ncbi:hypothetical protein [Allobranchiibius sp. GilTou38]|uniref:hypothetical protein n=1 Tax=Allobranchiibius sp. GilTou38 TaxID=2815210 RepID=UPI001AA0E46E|nr:hypothetical protein [Allobranchiibius sp. GilTou38]MBO1767055.1 hypothetical protein [Allobranchiibius sp. GilTou38]
MTAQQSHEPWSDLADLDDLAQRQAEADAERHHEPPTPALAFDLERPEFWESRPELAHLHQFARSRIASPWAVLGVALARVIAHVAPHYTLPPIVGAEGSLNTFYALTGASGSGKGAATACAGDAITFGSLARPEEPSLGTGEGVVATFVRRVKPIGGQPGGVEQHTTRALFHCAEVDTLSALKGRVGSTVTSVLRSAWSGEQLGFQNADLERRLVVGRHAYRLCLVVGVQPERAGVLLDEADGGMPQRLVWLPATDPGMPDQRPPELGPIEWRHPDPTGHVAHPGTGRYRLPVCDAATTAIEHAARARARGQVDALDGHALLCQLKVAAALGFLNGHAEVSDDDWDLAGVVMAVSDHTRGQIVATLSAKFRAASDARGRAEGQRAIASQEVVDEAATKRVAHRLRANLTDDWTTRSTARRLLPSRDRDHFEDAIDSLLRVGDIDVEEADFRGQLRTHYRLARGAR